MKLLGGVDLKANQMNIIICSELMFFKTSDLKNTYSSRFREFMLKKGIYEWINIIPQIINDFIYFWDFIKFEFIHCQFIIFTFQLDYALFFKRQINQEQLIINNNNNRDFLNGLFNNLEHINEENSVNDDLLYYQQLSRRGEGIALFNNRNSQENEIQEQD